MVWTPKWEERPSQQLPPNGYGTVVVEQSLMFRCRKPRTLFAFPAVISVCLDHVKLSVIETPRYQLVLDVSSILLLMVYNVSRASLIFFGIALMAVPFPGLNSICQSFYHCSSEDRSDWRPCWSMSVLLSNDALKEEAVVCEQLRTRRVYDIWKIINVRKEKEGS